MNTDKHWTLHAQENPYWAVVTWDKFKGNIENDPELMREFFETGRSHIDRVLAIIHHSICTEFQPRTALDFGCGVGRLIVPLAEKGVEVSGIDISEVMLDLSRKHLTAKSLPFVHLKKQLEELPLTAKFDLVHTFIVLQHIGCKRGLPIVDRLASLLTKGGVAVLHLTYRPSSQAKSSLASRILNMLKSILVEVPKLRLIAESVLRKKLSPPIIMDNYPLNDVMGILASHGLNNIYIRHSQHGEHQGIVIFAQYSELIPHPGLF